MPDHVIRYSEGEILSDEHYARVAPLIPQQMDLAQFIANCSAISMDEVETFAHGRFPKEDPTKQVIVGSWLDRHEAFYRELAGERDDTVHRIPVECYGLDVARSLRGDRTVLAAGGQLGMRRLLPKQIPDVTLIADWVIQTAEQDHGVKLTHGRVPIAIDYGGGYGSGVGDLLRRRGAWVIEFQPGGSSRFSPRNFANLRTESYSLLGQRLDPQGVWSGQPWAIPPDDRLRIELTAPTRILSSDMIRFIIEPKEEIKSRLGGRSPDLADATTYLFHAVRILHNLDEYFRSYERPPVIWPVIEPGSKLAERMDEERAAERERFADEWRREELRPEFAGLRLLDDVAVAGGREGGTGGDDAAVGKDDTIPAGQKTSEKRRTAETPPTGDRRIDEFVRLSTEMYGDGGGGADGDDPYGHLFGD